MLTPDVIDAEFIDLSRRHLREHLRVLSKYRWLVTTIAGTVFGLTLLVTLLLPRSYTATTRLQVARQSPIQLRLQENVLRVDESDRTVNGTSAFLQTQIAALQSRDVAERVIRGQHLVDSPALTEPSSDTAAVLGLGDRVLGMFRPRGWTEGSAQSPPTPAADTDPIDPLLLDAYEKWLSVTDVRGTDVIEVSFATPDPRLSAFLAAAHAQAYIEANDEARLGTNVTARNFLATQRQEAAANARRAEAALEQFASEHPNVAVNQDQQLAAQRITELSKLHTVANGERVGLQTRYQFLAEPGRDALPYFVDEPSIQKLTGTLADVRLRRAAVLGRLGPNHPEMLELGRQEVALGQQLRAEVTRQVASVRMQFDAAVAREEGLRSSLADLEQQQAEQRDLGTRYDLLRAEAESARALHQSLLKQQIETAVNSELVASNVRVLERPEVPDRPTWPRLPLNLGIGLVLGVGVAVGTAFACEYFDNSVKSSDEVEGLLQLPTLATVPNFALARRVVANGNGAHGERRAFVFAPAASDARNLVVTHEPHSSAAEAFRILRTAVLFSAAETLPRVLVVTSSSAGEGKTTVCANLATALAETGIRVLLVDADLRRPGCHLVFGVDNHHGLSTLLAGDAELASLVRPVGAGRLAFLAAGPPPSNPAELVGSARMRETLETLRERYDCVIIDTPPALPVTDAVVLAREADGVVLVVKGQDTPREIVRRAREQLALTGARLLGTVVNNVDFRWGDLYFFYQRGSGYYRRPPVLEGHA